MYKKSKWHKVNPNNKCSKVEFLGVSKSFSQQQKINEQQVIQFDFLSLNFFSLCFTTHEVQWADMNYNTNLNSKNKKKWT